jgi:tetratricopeptide (TPR) repeat protein
MPHEFKPDVFISYSSKDKEWVRGELLQRIEQAGLKAFIDFRDFTRGAPSIKECERGVVECRKTLLILTPNYVEHSEWGDMENVMLQTLDPANRQLRLIPLLKADCKKPLRIGALTHIDFTDGADLDLAWRQLLTALGAAPELPPPKEPEHPDWYLAHPYPMPPNFTGRMSERGTLTRWLNEDKDHPLLVLRALGGFGKSALTWHWLTHDVDAKKWPRVVWWSFYEGDASFEHFVAETLAYLYGQQGTGLTLSAREALVALLNALHQPGTLLVLDGFERVLRAFGGLEAAYQGDDAKHTDHDRDCVSPLAEDFLYNVALQPLLRSKVMLTTRLTPRIVEAKGGGQLQGCREVELRQMQPEDAVAFFHTQGIRGTHTEIELACEPYGYHPLSLRLLAGLIIRDFQQPGDIAAAKRLDVSGDLVQRQHHVLKQAYDSLAPARQKLLSSVACFRWPVSYDTLKAAAESEDTLDRDLRELVIRGLLNHDVKERRFDLHPIVRHYAYDRLAAPDRAATHTRLRDYFAAVPKVAKVTRLEDLVPVIELYHHTVRAGQLDEAWTLFRDRIWKTLYYQFGGYLLQIDLLRVLFPDGEDRPPRLKDESHRAHVLNELANSCSLSGQPRRAVSLYEQQNAIQEKLGSKSNLAIGLGNVGDDQLKIGALRATEANLRRSIALCREINEELSEGDGHRDLGRLLTYRGVWEESEIELSVALKLYEEQKHVQAQGTALAYLALRELLRLRTAANLKSEIPDLKSSLAPARRALELADEEARTVSPVERDYVRAHWLLGASHRVVGQPEEAERHLHEALERCRRINNVEHEADILIDLARLRAVTGAADEARRLAEEARLITERSGYVLQGADAHLELAKLALARSDKALAKEHAAEARKLATCDGPPDYTYKAAYDEAATLLSQLG